MSSQHHNASGINEWLSLGATDRLQPTLLASIPGVQDNDSPLDSYCKPQRIDMTCKQVRAGQLNTSFVGFPTGKFWRRQFRDSTLEGQAARSCRPGKGSSHVLPDSRPGSRRYRKLKLYSLTLAEYAIHACNARQSTWT